jgi:hypothetical protein
VVPKDPVEKSKNKTALLEQELAKKTAGIEFLHAVTDKLKDNLPFEDALKLFLESVCHLSKCPVGYAYVPRGNASLLVSKCWYFKDEA